MRWMLIAALSLAAPLAAAPAQSPPSAAAQQGVRNPVAFVRARFAQYQAGQAPTSRPDRLFSPRLERLFAALDAVEGGEERINFDWWVDAPDWEVSQVRVKPEWLGRGRLNVNARWRVFGQQRIGTFMFVRGTGGWQLDDVVSHTTGWTLSMLLEQAARR